MLGGVNYVINSLFHCLAMPELYPQGTERTKFDITFSHGLVKYAENLKLHIYELLKIHSMNISGNSILITDGAKNIGFALAEFFITHGNRVIICGQNEAELLAAKDKLPALETKVCNLALPAEREHLAGWAQQKFPHLNMLIDCNITQQPGINVEANLHLSSLLIPHLCNNDKNAAIVNFTSAASASLNSVLREKFKEKDVKIFEFVLPVNYTENDLQTFIQTSLFAIENDKFDLVIGNA